MVLSLPRIKKEWILDLCVSKLFLWPICIIPRYRGCLGRDRSWTVITLTSGGWGRNRSWTVITLTSGGWGRNRCWTVTWKTGWWRINSCCAVTRKSCWCGTKVWTFFSWSQVLIFVFSKDRTETGFNFNLLKGRESPNSVLHHLEIWC